MLPTPCILHIDLDSFFVSVERLLDPTLVGVPVIVGGSEGRGVVASCSYEARAFGVRSAMPTGQALKLCPHLRVVRGHMHLYGEYSRRVRDILLEEVPVLEAASIDEFYCDLTGLHRFHDPLAHATHIRQRIRTELGLPCSFGMATTKTTAKIATGMAKPDGQLEIKPGTEKAFLAPLPIRKIPMLGEASGKVLLQHGIQTIGDLQQLEPDVLVNWLGRNGKSIWLKANGLYASEVEPYSERKSVGKETTFGTDITDPELLESVLVGLSEGVGYRLRKDTRLAACLTVKIRYSDFETHTHQQQMPPTQADADILALAKALFRKNAQKKRPIRLLGIQVSHLVPGGPQLSLLEDVSEKQALTSAVDSLKNKYGAGAITRAATLKARKDARRS